MVTPIIYHSFDKPYQKIRVSRIVINETMHPGIVDRSSWGDFFLVAFFDSVSLEDEKGRRTVSPGHLICWTPEAARHYYGNAVIPWKHSGMHFEGPGARQLMDTFTCNRILSCHNVLFVNDFLLSLYRECAFNDNPDEIIVANTVENLVRDILRKSGAMLQPTAIPAHYINLRNRIRNTFTENLTVEQLASDYGISRSKLFKDYKKYFNSSPIDDRITAQMEQAHYLLRNRNLRISEISYLLGIDNPTYFSRLIKRHFGKGPRQLRAEL